MFNTHSNFWIGNWNSNEDVLTGKVSEGKDYVKLASTLRAVGNFVNIVTGKSIPVKFEGNDSYTDGKNVTISANVKDNNFDATVGLALHEGSHILLSDFDLLKNLENCVGDLEREGVDAYEVVRRLKDILNIVEDRRIDNFIYKNAPGYRPYYDAMYDKYFHSKAIDKGLKSSECREENWESYMFRLCNITNSNRDLDALKGLRDIWNVLDLANISKLDNTSAALHVAKKIYTIIDTCVMNAEAEKQEENDPSDCNCENGEKGQSEESKTPEGQSNDDGSTAEGEEAKSGNGGDVELTDREKNMLDNAMRKQRDFINSNVKKSKLSKKDRQKVEAISKSGASSKEVGKGSNHYDWKGRPTVDCIVMEKFDLALAESDVCDYLINNPNDKYWQGTIEERQTVINKGVQLGTMLGRKLQVRNNDRTLKYNRLRNGKIDRRAVAGLGYGAEAVFQKVMTDSHNAACLHISIDASGSMGGKRWNNSQIAAIAIAKAASMTNNLDVVISYRSIMGNNDNDLRPLMLIAYDSRKDKFAKITRLFKLLRPGGTTPAGLCFEAILDQITGMGDKSTDKYFINFSDGDPYFETKNFCYYGHEADKHTQKQVRAMKAAGVKVLSYYIDGSNLGDNSRMSFDLKYGKDSTAYVSVTEIVPLAKTLNKRFVEC